MNPLDSQVKKLRAKNVEVDPAVERRRRWRAKQKKAETPVVRVERMDELDKEDLRLMRRWKRAYVNGDQKVLKRDAGSVMGAVYGEAIRLIRRIKVDGPLVRTAKLVAGEKGPRQIVYEWIAHPLYEPLLKMLRLLHLDPAEFGMTPRGADVGTTPRGLIVNAEKVDIQAVITTLRDRYDQHEKALVDASRMRSADPVWAQFAGVQVVEARAEVVPET